MEEIIYKYFPEASINNLEENIYNIKIICSNTPDYIEEIYGNNINFDINYNLNYIYIHKLQSCNDSGFNILNLIKKLGKELNINYIKLIDKSIINNSCYISLSYIYILMLGKSWYNIQGFISKDYEEEQVNNIELINKSIFEFISICENKNLLSPSKNSKIISKINDLFIKIKLKYTIDDNILIK